MRIVYDHQIVGSQEFGGASRYVYELATRMADLIDFNTGGVITGEATIAQLGEDLLNLSIEVASGRVVPKAVALGQDDFLPWKRGVSL